MMVPENSLSNFDRNSGVTDLKWLYKYFCLLTDSEWFDDISEYVSLWLSKFSL